MKRILIAAVAAASLVSAAPAQAQLDQIAIADPNISSPCLTPVTKCVDEALDRVVASVERVYDRVGDLIQEPPPIGTVCELIWEGGCSDAVPF